MREQDSINYERIAQAIQYILSHYKRQPSLNEIAAHIHLSPSHFQRLFTDWAGTSPKKFLQYITVNYAKNLLAQDSLTLFETTYQSGLSSSSRLHDLFISIEGMSPAEYKKGAANLIIYYSFSESIFGRLIIASTHKGICYLAFEESEEIAVADLKNRYPYAQYKNEVTELHLEALKIFRQDWTHLPQIKLHLRGTDFQLKVWESLLTIPKARLSTYGAIANQIENKKSYRAVGTAIGDNPVAFLIPCHRVIQQAGAIGGYRWGTIRKSAIIAWEQALNEVHI